MIFVASFIWCLAFIASNLVKCLLLSLHIISCEYAMALMTRDLKLGRCCLHLAYDLFLVLLHICLNDSYDKTLLTWQSDICSISHMVSTFHCIASNLLKCLLLSLHIIVLIISCRPVFRTYYILLSCGCLTSKFTSSVSHINLF